MVPVPAQLPRVTIQFCTQCKWMLRAAYYAQELLSTFETAIGEVALQPSTGGTFIVSLYLSITFNEEDTRIQHLVLWDRKKEGGFPVTPAPVICPRIKKTSALTSDTETKELKKRLRDVIQPGRDLGHVDGKQKSVSAGASDKAEQGRQQLKANKVVLDGASQDQKSYEHQDTKSQPGISGIPVQEPESEKQSLLVNDGVEKEVKHADSSICEDCI